MAKKKQTVKLSPGEMEIMSVLWQHGPLSIAEAHQSLGRPLGYTTVQTRLNRLAEKGLVLRSDSRPARYSAEVTADQISANHLDVLVDRVAGGSVVPLVAHLVKQRSLSADELDDLKRIIEQAEVDQKAKGGKS